MTTAGGGMTTTAAAGTLTATAGSLSRLIELDEAEDAEEADGGATNDLSVESLEWRSPL